MTFDEKSQSPLVGAFVPAHTMKNVSATPQIVAIPSGRGIRSGSTKIPILLSSRRVAIPSGRGIRSGSFGRPEACLADPVAIPSGRGIRSGKKDGNLNRGLPKSQSPLVGAFVPAGLMAFNYIQ